MILMSVILDIVDCKQCLKPMVFIGSAQNGWMWYCRTCFNINFAEEQNNPKKNY